MVAVYYVQELPEEVGKIPPPFSEVHNPPLVPGAERLTQPLTGQRLTANFTSRGYYPKADSAAAAA